jgi:hypothetical protein
MEYPSGVVCLYFRGMAAPEDLYTLLKPATFEPSTAAFWKFDPDADCDECGGNVDAACLCCSKGWCAACFGFRIPTATENGAYLRKISSAAKVSLGDAFAEGRLCVDCHDSVHGHTFTARHPLTRDPLTFIRRLPVFQKNGFEKLTVLQHTLLWMAQRDANERGEPFLKAPNWKFENGNMWACTVCCQETREKCPRHCETPIFHSIPPAHYRYEFAVRKENGVRNICLKCAGLSVYPLTDVPQPLCPEHTPSTPT